MAKEYEYIKCPNCEEIDGVVRDKDGNIIAKCPQCGGTGSIRIEVDE